MEKTKNRLLNKLILLSLLLASCSTIPQQSQTEGSRKPQGTPNEMAECLRIRPLPRSDVRSNL